MGDRSGVDKIWEELLGFDRNLSIVSNGGLFIARRDGGRKFNGAAKGPSYVRLN